MKCIYCLEDKSNDKFTKTEHVMPQSFGTFSNNFVLNANGKAVCDNCNQYFGDNLEIKLARDTFEGISRVEHNVKKPSAFKSLGTRSKLIIRIAEGLFKGAYSYRYYSQQEGKVLLKPFPQVGFLKVGSSEYEFFPLDQIPQKDSLSEKKYNLDDHKGVIILGCDPKDADSLLKGKGFIFKIKGICDPPANAHDKWLCKVEGEIDQQIFRAIAKIGFNYLAYWEGVEFVKYSGFDPIRRFIRLGEKTDYPLIRVIDRAILADEIDSKRRRLGHIVAINWADDRVSVLAQISLFNWVTYCVCLAREFSGEQRFITRGNFFDVHNREILEMGARRTQH